MDVITSTRNDRVQSAVRLHRRRDRRIQDATIIEGPNVLALAIDAGVVVRDAFYLADDQASPQLLDGRGVFVSEEVLARVSDTEHPRGPVVVIERPAPELTGRDTLVMVGVKEPGNAGTIVRTAAAFAFDVLATPDTVDVWSPKVLRAGAGAHFITPVVTTGSSWMEDLGRMGIAAAALVVDGGTPLEALDNSPIALLVGEETAGLSPAIVENATHRVTFLMPGGTESLNAAVAAAIAMYERAKHR